MIKIESKINMRRRANFTHFHLISSRLNIDSALQLETSIKCEPQSMKSSIREKYIPHVSSSIISTVAAFESNINELLLDLKDKYDKQKNINITDTDSTRLMLDAIDCVSRQNNTFTTLLTKPGKPALVKYSLLSVLKKNEICPELTSMKSALAFIINLRNNIIHFVPEWEDEFKEHGKLEKQYDNQYKKKFKLSTMYNKDLMFFPYSCLSADCARWSLETVSSFIDEYKKYIS